MAVVSDVPGDGAGSWRFEVEGKPIADAARRPAATAVVAGKGYLHLVGLSLLRGNDFEDSDGLPGKEKVIVNQSFVTRFFPKQDPIGRQMRLYDREGKAKSWMSL